jgi:Glutathione peroxidase
VPNIAACCLFSIYEYFSTDSTRCTSSMLTKNSKSTTTEQDNTINITEPTTMTEGIIGITNFHYFTINSLDEEQTINMADFKGKKILIVNVASKCGYTSQYAALQKLHEKYGDQLQIIGFPCNQFMGQEPGTKEEIATFCSKNYGVTFPLTTKIDVKRERPASYIQMANYQDRKQCR